MTQHVSFETALRLKESGFSGTGATGYADLTGAKYDPSTHTSASDSTAQIDLSHILADALKTLLDMHDYQRIGGGKKYERYLSAVEQAEAALKAYNKSMKQTCDRCGGKMSEGCALENQLVGYTDKHGDSGRATMWPADHPNMVKVMKCAGCGRSYKI